MTAKLHSGQYLLAAAALCLCLAGRPALAGTAARLSLQPASGLALIGTTGTVYAVQYSTNFAQPGNWTCLCLLTAGTNAYAVPGTSGAPGSRRFYRAVALTNLVSIPAGTFTLGSPTNETDRYPDESPQTTVTLSQGFWMGRTPVIQQDYQSVCGTNPSAFTGDPNLPVEQVSWIDATNFCALLTQRELAAGRIPAGYQYRLPTEAEWEYACRAGTTTRFYYGDDPGYLSLANYAWYDDNSGGQTHPVAQKLPNPWGLYDMGGNVSEWCQGWYGPYPGGSVTNLQGAVTGTYRSVRGSSWDDDRSFCRSAYRNSDIPTGTYSTYGFRAVLAPSQ